jgi:drug/metabolite transporter (DMT)-like permease
MSLFSKMAVENFLPTEIIFYRALAGMLLLAAFMKHNGISFKTNYPFSHLKRCLAGSFCFLFEIPALYRLPLSVAQTIRNTSPLLFTLFFILMAVLHREKVQLPAAACVFAGFIGVLFIAGPASEGINALGVLYAFTGAVLAASASWFIRDLGKQNESNERTVFYFMLSGVVLGLLGTPLSGTFHFPSLRAWYPIIGVILSGLFAQIFRTFSRGAGAPLLNSVFEYSGIAFGAVLGFPVFHETVSLPMIIGMCTIALAGISSSRYAIRQSRPKPDGTH